MSTQIRGFEPATRVMSRSDPPAAAASGSCPSIRAAPAWLTSRLASAWGRWLVRATRRSWTVGSTATGVAPSDATKPWTRRCVAAEVWGLGVRNQEAPSKRSARACAGPCASEPQTGWPPTNLGEGAAAATRALVEPTSVTEQPPRSRRGPPRPYGRAARPERRRRTGRRRRDALEARGDLVDRAALGGDGEGALVRIEARHGMALAPGGEPDGGADQPGADDRDAHATRLEGDSLRNEHGFAQNWFLTMARWPWNGHAGRTTASISWQSA